MYIRVILISLYVFFLFNSFTTLSVRYHSHTNFIYNFVCSLSFPYKFDFNVDPDHFHSCEKTRRACNNQRHNNIVQVIIDLARAAGFIAIHEPNSHIRPDSSSDAPSLIEGFNKHADMLLLKHDMKLYIDVVITRPTNATHLRKSPRVQDTPLASTHSTTQYKHAKYDEIAAVNDYKFFAFTMETYGGISDEAMKLLNLLSSHSHEYPPVEFLQHALCRLSCTLQSSNATIPLLSMQTLHLHRQALNHSTYDAYCKRHQQRIQHGYSSPMDNERIMNSIKHSIQSAEVRISEEEFENQLSSSSSSDESSPHRSSTPTFVHDNPIGFADSDSSIEVEVDFGESDIDLAAEEPIEFAA